MRILVCGDRNWTDTHMIYDALVVVVAKSATIIQGGARGADTIAASSAAALGLGMEEFPADWHEYGKAAGPIRNQRMLDEGKPDEVWAFHDNLEISKGTRDMVARARKAGLPVRLFRHRPPSNWFVAATK